MEYGTWARLEGKLDELEQGLIDESKEMVTEALKDQMKEQGIDPGLYYYESFTRQQYNNEDKTSAFDDPIFKVNIPFVTVAVKATPKE